MALGKPRGAEVLTISTDAWVQVVNDDARAQGGYRAKRAWERNAWKAERDTGQANKVAQQVKRAAALTAELAAQSEKKTAVVCDQPPGLDELAGLIEAPNMGAGGSHPQATMMPDHGPHTNVPLQMKAKPRPAFLLRQTRAPSLSRRDSVKLDPSQPRETWRREAWLTKLWTSM